MRRERGAFGWHRRFVPSHVLAVAAALALPRAVAAAAPGVASAAARVTQFPGEPLNPTN